MSPVFPRTRIGDKARIWITPSVENELFSEAMNSLLMPHGIAYEINGTNVVLMLTNQP